MRFDIADWKLIARTKARPRVATSDRRRRRRSLRPGRAKLIPRCTFAGCAPNRFVLPNNFMNDKGEELFGNGWVKFADRREMPQTTELLGFSAGIARGQSVLRLQFSHRAGTPKPLRQHVDDRGIDIVDAVPQVAKFGNG